MKQSAPQLVVICATRTVAGGTLLSLVLEVSEVLPVLTAQSIFLSHTKVKTLLMTVWWPFEADIVKRLDGILHPCCMLCSRSELTPCVRVFFTSNTSVFFIRRRSVISIALSSLVQSDLLPPSASSANCAPWLMQSDLPPPVRSIARPGLCNLFHVSVVRRQRL